MEDDGAEWLAASYADCAALCRRYANRLLADSHAAADVVQEVFLAAWLARHSFDPTRGSVRSWLLTLTHHKAVDAIRTQAAQRRHAAFEPAPSTGADDPAVLAVAASQRLTVRAAVQALPPATRQTIALAYWADWTQGQIAERSGTPLGTVKARAARAQRRLAAELVDERT